MSKPRKPKGSSFMRAARQKERLAKPVVHLDPVTTKVDPVVKLSPGQAAAEELLDNVKSSQARVRLKTWTAQWLEMAERRQGQQAKPHGKRRKPNRRGRKRTAPTSRPKVSSGTPSGGKH